ncbi:MAG: hypothetical protein ACKOGH_20260 [Alphaproteobacteria bacterium]
MATNDASRKAVLPIGEAAWPPFEVFLRLPSMATSQVQDYPQGDQAEIASLSKWMWTSLFLFLHFV